MDLIVLTLAIIYAVKRRRIVALKSSDFPHIPFRDFYKWKSLELRSRDIIIWTGFGCIGMEILGVSFCPGYFLCLYLFFLTPGLLFALTMSAVIGSRAAKIKKAYGFQIPK